jgi:hypothetical protein
MDLSKCHFFPPHIPHRLAQSSVVRGRWWSSQPCYVLFEDCS